MIKTVNFIEMYPQESTTLKKLVEDAKKSKKYFVDSRTGIGCVLTTNDFLTLYKNYINLINDHMNEWVHAPYIDIGYVPLVYFPSFFPPDFERKFKEALITKIPIHLISLPKSSTFSTSRNYGTEDLWCLRSDLADVLHCDILEATLSRLLGGLSL